jgi:hypothetical protein
LQPVPGRYAEIPKILGLVKVQQLAPGRRVELGWEAPDRSRSPIIIDILGELVAEGSHHDSDVIVTR